MAEAAVVAASSKASKTPTRESLSDRSETDQFTATVDNTCGKAKTKKKPTKNDVFESRLSVLEKSFESKFEQLFNLVQNQTKNKTGGHATRLEDRLNSGSIGARSPTQTAQNDDDLLSLHPNEQESDHLRNFMDDTESDDSSDSQLYSKHMPNDNKKSSQLKTSTQNVLSQLFGDEDENDDKSTGLILDKVQVELLNKSWRSSQPERVGAFKEEYRQVFPIHEHSRDFLQVPGLDDMLETMLSEKYGPRAVKSWDRNKHLFSQPLRGIESMAFQGQLAARYGIIALLYLQQSLGSLMTKLQCLDNEDISQEVKNAYDISLKALDQMGRTGAHHHMIRRKAAIGDTGLMKSDVQSKITNLPLSGDGVFGKELQEKFKQRKERKDQLSDWLADEFKKPETVKRKFPPATATRPSGSAAGTSSGWHPSDPKKRKVIIPSTRGRQSFTQPQQSEYKPKYFEGNKTGGNASAFRIPKRN